jgi:isopenicillin-N N-acyltransferase like protein
MFKTRFSSLGIVVLILFNSAFISPLQAGEKSSPVSPAQLKIIELSGTPYERGKTHGRTLRAEILELIKRWKEDLAKTSKVSAEDSIRNFLGKTDFKPAIDRWTPGLLDEVRGIADGAGVDFDTMYAYQLIDEFWTIGADLNRSKCTSIAVGKRNGNPVYVSQTLDMPVFYHGFQTVLRIKEENGGIESLVYAVPGIVASNGMNNFGIGVCVNAVTQLANSPKGLPVAFAIRGILRQKTYEQAVQFLQDIQPAAPQNYVIGGPDEAASFERSAKKMVRFVPFEGAGFTYHTNHPLLNDDLNPNFLEYLMRSGIALEKYRTDSCPRYSYLGRILKDDSAAPDLAGLKALYQNRASGINNRGTYGCTIMVLGPNPELHIAPGRPDEEPFQVLGFSPRPVR